MIIGAYLTYLAVSIAVAVWVGQSLHKNGRVFLIQSFQGDVTLADSVNHLLLVGFYLINIGFISLALQMGDKPHTLQAVIEYLSMKIGLAVLVLGVMHMFNMRALMKYRQYKLGGEKIVNTEVTYATA